MKKFILAAALSATMLAGTTATLASAQGAPPAPQRQAPPPRADTDNDGVVTRDEAIADADRRFAEMDANHDGKISRDERRTFREQRRADRRAARGVDAPPPPPPPGAEGPRPHGDRDRDGPRGMKDRDETQAQFRDRALKMFDRADTNHDGRVDSREREAMALLMRARMADHDHRGPPPADTPPADTPRTDQR